MTKRLQVLLDDAELSELQRFARERRMTVAEIVRQTLRAARAEVATPDLADRLATVKRAYEHQFPIDDIDVVLGEIERGYLGARPPDRRTRPGRR